MSGVRGDRLNDQCETCGGRRWIHDLPCDGCNPSGTAPGYSRPVPGDRPVVWEVERDRHGVMFSGPLAVGECIRVIREPESRPVLPEQPMPEGRACGCLTTMLNCENPSSPGCAMRPKPPAVQPVPALDPEGIERAATACDVFTNRSRAGNEFAMHYWRDVARAAVAAYLSAEGTDRDA